MNNQFNKNFVLPSKQLENQLPTFFSIEPNRFLFVTDWVYSKNEIYAIGCDSLTNAFKMNMNLLPGLYVMSNNIKLLHMYSKLLKFTVRPTRLYYRTNNFTLYDRFCDYGKIKPKTQLVKLETHTFDQTKHLHNFFKYQKTCYKIVGITQYWELFHLILMELIVKNEGHRSRFLYTWFDANLDRPTTGYDEDPPIQQNFIAFDIETVASDRNRIPTGEEKHDHLFSVSIYVSPTEKTYCGVFIPIQGMDKETFVNNYLTQENYNPNKHLVDFIKTQELLKNSPNKNEKQKFHQLVVFDNEIDLLRFTVETLHMKQKLHYITGWNSDAYDLEFLYRRCSFYNIKELLELFVIRDSGCKSVTFAQINFDLYKSCVIEFSELENHKLGTVSAHVLNDSKIDLDSRLLRFTFGEIAKKGMVERVGRTNQNPCIFKALEYNVKDTLLVTRLLQTLDVLNHRSGCINSIIGSGLTTDKYLNNYKYAEYRILNQCFFIGLKLNIFLCKFNSNIGIVKYPLVQEASSQTLTDYFFSIEKLEDYVKIFDASGKEKKHPGGVNWCQGKYYLTNVSSYDYDKAYSTLIDRRNISDETCSIFRANILYRIYDTIDFSTDKFICFDYKTHMPEHDADSNKLSTLSNSLFSSMMSNRKSRIGSKKPTVTVKDLKQEKDLLMYQYLYEGKYVGSEFTFTKENLAARGNDLVIVIWRNRPGTLALIVREFNSARDFCNKYKKLISDQVIPAIQTHITDLSMQDYDDDDDDDGDDVQSEKDEIITDESNDDLKNVEFINEKLGFTWSGCKIFVTAKDSILVKCPDVVCAQNCLAHVKITQSRLEMEDRHMKPTVSSIYGIASRQVSQLGAAITAINRSNILAKGQLCVQRYNSTILFIDTDSLFISTPQSTTIDFTTIFNSNFPDTTMRRSDYREVFFIQKKTKYDKKKLDSQLKYSQKWNGPQILRTFVNFVIAKKGKIRTMHDIEAVFKDFFANLATIKLNREMFLEKITLKDSYANNCPRQQFADYLSTKKANELLPVAPTSNKINGFMYFQPGKVEQIIFRPEEELLESIVNYYDELHDFTLAPNKLPFWLSKVNLHLFFLQVLQTVTNILEFYINDSNMYQVPIILQQTQMKKLMLKSFLHWHSVHF